MFGKGGKAMPYRYRHLRGLQGRIPICIPYFYYPQNLLSKGLSAKVAMSVDISASGKVLRVRVLSDTSGGLASKGAVKYMKGWKFKPANHETHDFEYGVKYQILK